MLAVAPEPPDAPDVVALLRTHLEFAHQHTLPEEVYALDADRLAAEDVTFFTAREEGRLLGVGALKQLDATHAEIKSMHTVAASRGKGVGRAVLEHLLATARARGCTRVSLETGTQPAFESARELYRKVGFEPCPPFADYAPSPNSVCMTLRVE